MDIKNIIKNTSCKIPKFNLKLYAFVYDKLVEFPKSDIFYNTVTTDDFFRSVYRMIKVKMHLHYSHITGEILGYVHDFCNWKVRENKTGFVIFAHNIFGFDMFFDMLKGFRTTAWNTKNINTGGTNLTNINFANIGGVKYYQKSLGQLAAALSVDEKLAVKKVAEQFLRQHDYFSEVWKYLGPLQKEKILDIIADSKGIIPYEKIVDANSLCLTLENGVFFEKSEFYSDLKQKSVADGDYDSSLYLYKILKIRNLGDMNDLYNTQDVILWCKIIENRFQLMHDRYGFVPRKCNSASSLSGSIERDLSKVIIALPTTNEIIDVFE